MDHSPLTEALIWISMLTAALERADRAVSATERLAALEAIDEAQTQLADATARMREQLALGLPTPSRSPLLS
jgi:hypothetical protein